MHEPTTGADPAQGILMQVSTGQLGRFACPVCHARLERNDDGARCTTCAAAYPLRDGFIDFAPGVAVQAGVGQRFMEAPLVTRVYEHLFRPALTRLVSPLDYAAEERYLSQWFRPAKGDVLDLSCGTGRYTRWVAAQVGPERVIGLDLSLAMLRRAGAASGPERTAATSFVRGSALSLPFAPRSLAAVTCFGALHLYPDPGRALLEVGRVLRPGGTLVCLTTATAPGLFGLLGRRLMHIADVHPFEAEELRRLVAESDLEVLDLMRAGLMVLFACQKR